MHALFWCYCLIEDWTWGRDVFSNIITHIDIEYWFSIYLFSLNYRWILALSNARRKKKLVHKRNLWWKMWHRRCSAKNPWCSGQGEFVFHILYWDFFKQIYLNYFLFFRTKRYIRLEDSDWRIWLKLFYNSEIELVEQVLRWSSKRL